MKRGQVSVFVIVGVLIVVLILIFFIVRNSEFGKSKVEIQKIHSFVQDCIEKESMEVIYEIGEHGGYYNASAKSTESGIAIYYDKGEINIPSIEDIEKEISFYLEKRLPFCTRNFTDFKDYKIEQSKIEVEADIRSKEVKIKVHHPLKITKGENVVLLEDFEVKIPVKLGIFYNSAKEFIEEQKDYGGVCLNCLLDVSVKNDFYVDMINYGDNIIVFIFKETNQETVDERFMFIFANKYLSEEDEV